MGKKRKFNPTKKQATPEETKELNPPMKKEKMQRKKLIRK